MEYVLDGYNVLNRLSVYRHIIRNENLEAARFRLESDCAGYSRQKKLRIVIVYDNQEFISSHKDRRAGIQIEFSPPGITADEYIYRKIIRSKSPGEITVVTADRSLQDDVQSEGAQVISPSDFFKILRKNRSSYERNQTSEKPDDVDLEYWKGIFNSGTNNDKSCNDSDLTS